MLKPKTLGLNYLTKIKKIMTEKNCKGDGSWARDNTQKAELSVEYLAAIHQKTSRE